MQRQYTYPFTLISSAGLGTTGSSLDRIGSLLPLEGYGGAQLLFYPNINTGNLVLHDHLLPIDELGGKIRLGFTYNSQVSKINQLWQLTDKRFTQLSPTDKTAVLKEADGHLTTYTLNTKTGFYTAPASTNGIAWLRFHDKEQQWYRYQPWDNTTEIYNTDGLLLSHEDMQGRKIQYQYDNDSQLKAIIGLSGSRYEVRRAGNTVDVYLTGGSDDQLLKSYQFDEQGRLLFSMYPKGYKTEYQYGSSMGAWQLIQVKQSDQTLLKFSYDEQKRLSTFNLGQISVFRLQYVDDLHPEATLRDAYNGMTYISFDANADIVKVSRSQGFTSIPKEKDTTLYIYNTLQQLVSMTHPNGGEEKFTWLDFFGLMLSHTKPNGQVSEMVYHEDGDNVRLIGEIQYEEEKHIPLVTRYTYDNHYNQNHAFLRFKISPKGHVTEYKPDKSGNIASERKYLDSYINFENRDPHTSPSLDEMQKWVAEQTRQNITLTEYAYNLRGQLILTHLFAAIDEKGNGIKDDQMGEAFTFPNLYGNWFMKQVKQTSDKENNNAITKRTFDDLQRLISETDALQQTTSWQYLDTNGQVQIKRPNGRVELQQKNDRGLVNQVQEVVSSDNRLVKYERDTNGRVALIVRPDGQFVYPFYDHQDRLGYEVTTSGIVTEYVHDVQHRYQSETTYATSINPEQLFFEYPPKPGNFPDVGKLIKLLDSIRNPDKDRTSYVFYDLSDRPVYRVDSARYVTQFAYDKLDRKTLEIKWHKALTDTELSQLKTGINISLEPDFEKDRCTRYFYDHDSMLIGEQDAGGYVTEYGRGFAGQLLQKIQYANKAPINLAKIYFNEVRPIPSEQDARNLFRYNARLEVWNEYSPASSQEGYYRTQYFYYPNGLQKKSIQEHDKVSEVSCTASQSESEKDRVTHYQYDLLNRPAETVLPNQKLEIKKYDVAGNLILQKFSDMQHPEKIEPDYQRSLGVEYDGWDQKIKDINVFGGESTHRYDPLTGLKTHTIDALKHVTYYFYDIDKRLVATVDPVGAITENILDNSGNIIQTTRYANQILQGKITEGGYLTQDVKKLFVADPSHDQIAHFVRDLRGLVVQKTDARGNHSRYEYNAFSQVTVERLPVENADPVLLRKHDFDARGLEVMTTTSAPNVSSEMIVRLYNNFRGKETYRLDTRNGIYRMGYDLRGLTSQMVKDDGLTSATHQFTYNAFDELETETDALGNITTHSYNILERTQITDFPVTNVREIVTQNIFNEMVKREDALHHAETWQHAANGETHIYTDALQQKHTNEFNVSGQLIKVTDANLVVTELEYDPVGDIASRTEDATGLKYKTVYVRDAFSNPVIVTDPRKIVKKNKFDQSNNQTESVRDAVERGLNLITSNEYNAQNKKTVEKRGDKTNPQQYTETFQIDGRNRLIGSTIDPQGLAIKVARHLDAASDVIAEIDGNGNISRKFYDTLGRLRFTVDAEGGVTEKNYDKEDRILYSRVYEIAIDPGQLNDQTDLKKLMEMVKTDSADTLLYYFYDADGMERFQANSLGAVGEHQYNLAKHEIKSIQYAKQVDPVKLPGLTTKQLEALLKPGPDDRITRYILDEKYQQRFVIDAENYISEKRYDGNGNVITGISYAVKVADPEKIAKLPANQVFAQLVKDPVNDRAKYAVFDSFNHPEYVVDGEGYVTQYWHDENGNLSQSCEYKNGITVPENYADLVILLKGLAPDVTRDRIIKSGFDAVNRKISETDPLNHVDLFKRDVMDNIILHTDRANQSWLYHYDTASRLEIETTPKVTVTRVQKKIVDQAMQLTYDTVESVIDNKKIRDNNGNETQVIKAVNSSSPRTLECVYNKRDQLITTKIANVLVDDDARPGNFENPPVKMVDVTTHTVYNAKKLKVCEQNEASQWFFYVYDSEGGLAYTVNSLGFAIQMQRNTFGEIIAEVSYAKKINLNLSLYIQTGIPLNAMQQQGVIIHDSEDRTKVYIRDDRGNIVNMQQGPVFYYLSNGTDHPVYKLGYSQIRQQYNAFRQCICLSTLMDPKHETWSQQLYWFNRRAETVAECDPVYRVIRHTLDSFGNEIERVEWAKSPKIYPTSSTSLVQLDASHDPSADDRTYVYEHDLAGQLIRKMTKQVVIQEMILGVNDVPSMKNLLPQDLTQQYQYSPIQQQIAVTYEDGSTAYTWYDAMGQEIAVTDVARKRPDNGVSIIPLTYKGYDFFGQQVKTTRFKTGTAFAIPGSIPLPIATDKDDQTELKCMDNRGLMQFSQNAESVVTGFTFTGTRKVARQYYTITNHDAKHVDEKKFDFDAMNQPNLMRLVRDNQTVKATASQYNAFGNCIAEGPHGFDATFPLYRRFDVLGRCWSTNENGVNKIMLGNLSGQVTVELKSPTRDLSLTTYDQLETILTWKPEELEREEISRDAIGRKIIKTKPAYSEPDSKDPINIPLGLVAGRGYPDMGDVSLTWVLPQETMVLPKFTLWPVGHPEQKQLLEIKTVDNRCGVNVSHFASDMYEYKIDYYFENPITKQPDKDPLYRTIGKIEFDTNNNTNSFHPVVSVEKDNQLHFTGNTLNLTAIALWQDNQKIAEIPVQSLDGKVMADLSKQDSGIYTLAPIIAGKEEVLKSLPFTIYTEKPAKKPLSKEIMSTFSLKFLEQAGHHAQLIWNVPEYYQQAPVLLTCKYLDNQDQVRIHEDLIARGTDKGHYTDKDGNVLICNTEFEFQMKSVMELSLTLRINEADKIMIASQMIPVSANGDGVDVILDSAFIGTTVLCITPLKGFGKLPTLSYLDMSKDRLADWKELISLNMTSESVVVDVTGMQPCIYPFKVSGQLLFMPATDKVQYWHAIMPGESEPIMFTEAIPLREPGQNFRLLKTDREAVADFLIHHKNDEKMRQQLSPDIFQALVSGAFMPPDDKWLILKNAHDIASTAFQELAGTLSRRKITHSITWDEERLNEEKAKVITLQTRLMKYSARVKTYQCYVNALRETGELGVQAAFLYAKEANISLFLWEKDTEKPWHYKLVDAHDAGKSARQVLHLDVTGCTQFNVLLPEGTSLASLYGDEPLPFFTVTQGRGVLYNSDKLPEPSPEKILSSYKFAYDNWNNLTRMENTNKDQTDYTYNYNNQPLTQTQPMVNVVKPDGKVIKERPIKASGYNARGFKIAEVDPNGSTQGFILDNAGQEVFWYVGDGTKVRRQIFNALLQYLP